ncbi:MAG: SDR family oxidoreductase [Chloroflexi bacterium]|nr:SDR family oxidoreductase [Chloroflexota bacterium]
MGRLEGKVAIVTGGAQGIGGATARRLAEEGAKVLIADIDDAMAEKNAESIRAAGNVADVVRVDVSKHADIEMMVGRAMENWGRLDILFSNAFGVLTAGSGGAVEVSEEDWDSQMAVLLKAIFLGVKHAVPEMRKVGGGSIVNVSSVHGMFGAPGALVYETAKHAVIGATRQMATEYGPDGIRVNAVLPGHMLTERLREHMWKDNPSGLEFFKNQYPLRDVGRAEDIANAVLFLCSDEASFITGHPLVVDGGHSIQLQENFGVRQAHFVQENPDTQLPY